MLVISQTEGNGAAVSAWFTLCGLRKQGAGDRESPNSALNKSNLKGQMARILPGTNETISI